MSQENDSPKAENEEKTEAERPMTPLERVRANQAKMRGQQPGKGHGGGGGGSAGANTAGKRPLFNRKAG